PYWDIDTGMAALLMLLQAVDLGLGACFFGVQPENLESLRTDFGIPRELLPIGAVSVGRRAREAPVHGSGRPDRRRPAGDVIHRGHW
ncbi:MAG: nitroreductase family protein, partial [Acidimicrobiales bacterium]